MVGLTPQAITSTVPAPTPSQLLIVHPRVHANTLTVVNSSPAFSSLSHRTEEYEGRPRPTQRESRHLDGATPQHLSTSTSTYSALSQLDICGQDSPQVLASPGVAPSDLTQVLDLLALLVDVTSTTPVAAWTVPTPIFTISSATGLVASEGSVTQSPSQTLTYLTPHPV